MGRPAAASIRILTKSITVRFTLDGRRREITLSIDGNPLAPNNANIKYANRLAAEIQVKLDAGTFHLAEYFPEHAGIPQAGTGPVTAGAYLDSWIGTQRLEDSTKSGYASAIRFWKAAPADDRGTKLGTLPLRTLTLTHLMHALASRPTLSGKTVNNYVSVLREALDLAVIEKLIPGNPAAELKRAKHQKPPPDPFEPEERDRIIAKFAELHAGQPHNMVDFWFWAGPRTSEIFGLPWANVDLASGQVLVAEANVRGKQKKTTKTNVARTVILNSRARAAIERQRQHTQLAGDKVFKDPRYDTSWGDERAWRRSYWQPVLKLLGIRYRRPYNMRHTYATAMLMAGMTPAFCAKQLGHSIKVFLDTYAKWIDGAASEREMRRLEESFGGESGKEDAKKDKTR